ncbi:GAF domain-containing protein [Aminobacter niigataensis]|uniref:GAF domain-containing protein n=1 Tax=Aminobacter niigataensis TaxID=83265 RepID=UPI0024C6CA23|nr:GAF domain-containing protein [Aminobacter niigataensis]CAI2935189.1 conserved protein of unknown function [Aminobacter niigataensis]
MTETKLAEALVAFDAAIATMTEVEGVWKALQALADVVVGAKLFTVMKLDWASELSSRTYTSHPDTYPVSGTKPMNRTHWFDTIHVQRKPFVANTIKDIADVFPDHETIWSLGCGSVLNWPVFVGDTMLGTVNMLHEEHYYTPQRVEAAKQLSLAAKAAFLAVEHLERR